MSWILVRLRGLKELSSEFSENVYIKDWLFNTGNIDARRLSYLRQDTSYLDIAQRVTREARDIHFRARAGSREAKFNIRAEFDFSVEPETLDIFFNGSQGIRAQYYLDTRRGIESNRLVIDLLKDRLIEVVCLSSQDRMTLEQIEKSLNCGSAKIWIDEDSSTLNQTSRNREDIMDLDVPRWAGFMAEVLMAWRTNKLPIPSVMTRALLGVQTPEGRRLRVIGAWLDERGEEFVAPSKINRAQHIHDYGFS